LEKKIQALVRASWEGSFAILEGSNQVDVVGHRVVHGGLEFSCATLVTSYVEIAIDKLAELAPLHNPANLSGIRACRQILGEAVPQFAVFDTAFHRTLPETASTYAGPYEWVQQGMVRYGFHGTSYRYASRKAIEILQRHGDENLCQIAFATSVAAVPWQRFAEQDLWTPPWGSLRSTASRCARVPERLILD
jgi:acetate kinase